MVTIKAKNPEKVLKGKNSRAAGNAFEKKVREDLEKKGRIVDKWTNQVEFYGELEAADNQWGCKNVIKARLVPAKPKFVFNPGLKRRVMVGNSSGFPDFVVWHKDLNSEVKKQMEGKEHHCVGVFGVESKMDGKLDAAEKKKCQWLLEQGIFIKILIAYKEKEGRKIVVKYKDFEGI